MTLEEELALVVRAKAGERDAVGILWEEITPKLYGYLLNVLREKAVAEDILQQTWVKAISGIHQFKPRGVRFSAWLFAIARNECREYWRRPMHRVVGELSEQIPSPDQLSPIEEKFSIERIFKRLSQEDQELLRLRYIAELSFKEIARVLRISTVAARVRIHRALGRARVCIEKQ